MMFNNNEKEMTEEKATVEGTSPDNNENVHKDQQSMFDEEDAFSESMVVEKAEVSIDSGAMTEGLEDEFGDTAVFSFAKDKPEGSAIEHEELSVGELQGTAKEYYNATHADRVDDKVDELKKLVDVEFAITKEHDKVNVEDDLADTKEHVKVDAFEELFAKEKSEKDKKAEKKLRRKGIVSDDDIELLSGAIADESFTVEKNPEPVVSDIPSEATAPETNSTEYINPLVNEDVETEIDEDNKLMGALGGVKKVFDAQKKKDDDEDDPEIEYVSKEQELVIFKSLRSKAISSIASIVFTAILTALCIYFEAAVGTKAAHPEVFEPGKYGITYALCMLQFMFAGIIFNFDGVKRAFLGLRPSKSSAEGICAMNLIVCTLHTIVSCVIAHNSASLKSYCSIGCISLLMLSINSFIKAYTSFTSFCVAASKAHKTASFSLGKTTPEASKFEKYLDDDTTIITVGKGSFVKGFFKKTYTAPAVGSKTFKTAMVFVILAIAVGSVKGVLAKDVYAGVCTFSAVCLASLPVNALLTTALPFLVASMKAKKTQTAYIGEAAPDAYESCGIISFDDTEVFPAKSVKVSSIRTYGENRIDKVILYMARIFDKIEGPLSHVFANSVQNIENSNIEAQIVEQHADGISVKIDDKEILVGTSNFMRLYYIETSADNIDESFLQSLGSIMYMSVDGALAAKFYIKYTMNRNFESVLRSFYDAGICVGIKTLDPCITTELVCGNLKGSNYPVAVIKGNTVQEIKKETDSAIISLSGVHNFLRGFIRLDNLRNVYRTNSIISLVGSIAGLGLAAFFGITSSASIGITFLAAFQLIWCVPTVVFSLISKK